MLIHALINTGFFFFFLHTYILLLGSVFAIFHASTVSLSAILGGLHVRRKKYYISTSQITYNLIILLMGQIYCNRNIISRQ